uniref:DUF4833 domain-containing protein n=1 Tax=Neobodo designis TaxID=312471 RepID=A0A7S1MJ36_NEODS
MSWPDAEEIVVFPERPRGERFRGDSPALALIILRSKNQNVVCYEARSEADTFADKLKRAISGYWMDVDPPYAAKARASGKESDRDDLSMLEHQFAYGFACKDLEESTRLPEDLPRVTKAGVSVSFVAIAKRSMELRWLVDSGLPVIIALLKPNGTDDAVPCVVERVWVQSTEPKGFFSMPTVEYVDLIGYRLDDATPVAERVQNS